MKYVSLKEIRLGDMQVQVHKVLDNFVAESTNISHSVSYGGIFGNISSTWQWYLWIGRLPSWKTQESKSFWSFFFLLLYHLRLVVDNSHHTPSLRLIFYVCMYSSSNLFTLHTYLKFVFAIRVLILSRYIVISVLLRRIINMWGIKVILSCILFLVYLSKRILPFYPKNKYLSLALDNSNFILR